MTATQLISQVRAFGGDLQLIAPGTVTVFAARPLPAALLASLRAENTAIARLLAKGSASTDAVRAHASDAHEPQQLASAVARLDPSRPPAAVPHQRWVHFITDARAFVQAGWHSRAHALGWQAAEMFAADHQRPCARHDRAGVVWLLNGNRVVAITTMTATIVTATGSKLTYRRSVTDASNVALAWELTR